MEHMLQKRYRLRLNRQGKKSIIMGLPYAVVDQEARKVGLSVEQFLDQYEAVTNFNGSGVVYITFERNNWTR
jgi:hypothetical protein